MFTLCTLLALQRRDQQRMDLKIDILTQKIVWRPFGTYILPSNDEVILAARQFQSEMKYFWYATIYEDYFELKSKVDRRNVLFKTIC